MMKQVVVTFFILATFCGVYGVTVEIASPFTSTFTSPVDIQNDGTSSKLYIVEQAGIIDFVDTAKPTVASSVFLNIQSKVTSGGERGLLGLAFHPRYTTNKQFFVFYTTSANVVLERYTAINETVANAASGQILLTVAHPQSNHNGGQIRFGSDGFLYIGMGDGGGGGDPDKNGQKKLALLGKLLRIDVDKTSNGKQYAIPADNPFVNDGTFAPEIWAWGLRNPWRWSFDSQTQEMWVADVGQGTWEEVDRVKKGGNYGWNVMEGLVCFEAATCDKSGKELPVHVYGRSVGQSITGGFVYRGFKATPIVGKYIFADYATNNMFALNPATNTAEALVATGVTSIPKISAFGTDVQKNLYAAAHGQGKIYLFAGNGTAPTAATSGSSVINVFVGVFFALALFM